MQETIKKIKPIIPLRPPQMAAWHGGITIQLSLSHLTASAVALGLALWLPYLHVQQIYTLLIALAAACLCGFLCTFNLQYSLSLLELSLSRLGHGQPRLDVIRENGSRSVAYRWPLAPLFLRIHEVELRIQHYAKHELLTTDLREKALQQVREAAALVERNRIARELHDSIKQQIFSMSISAAAAKAHWQDENAKDAGEAIEDIQHSAKEVQVEMQALFQQLRPAPLENTSLIEALQVQAQALGFRTNAQMHIELGTLPQNDRMLPGTPEAIFRLVQEAFANVAKHARAQTIWLVLCTQEQFLYIEVRDDGQGFDMAQVRKSMGLNNLHERAQELHGQVEISSQPGQGTTVVITIPLLAALCSPEEEARQRYELARADELSRRGYQLCKNASLMCLAMMLIGIIVFLSPLWSLVVLGMLLVAVYGYASGNYYHTRVMLSTGRESQAAMELGRHQYKGQMELMDLAALGTFYTLDLTNFLHTILGQALLVIIVTCLFGLILFIHRQHYRILERYYDQFPSQELSWELERRKQGLVRALTAWCIVGFINLITIHSRFVLPPHTPAQQNAYDIAALILGAGFVIFSEYFYVKHCQQTWSKRAQNVSAQAREDKYV